MLYLILEISDGINWKRIKCIERNTKKLKAEVFKLGSWSFSKEKLIAEPEARFLRRAIDEASELYHSKKHTNVRLRHTRCDDLGCVHEYTIYKNGNIYGCDNVSEEYEVIS